MTKKCIYGLSFFLVFLLATPDGYSKTIKFSNLTWDIREGFGGSGPNNWSSDNVWVDSQGWLHLKITKVKDKWYGSEVISTTRLGFGQYWFYVIGRVDKLDPNIVFGLFNYPKMGTGVDGTNEIDIEFSKWGSTKPRDSNMSYTVWPAILASNKTVLGFTLKLTGDYSTHGFVWRNNKIVFQSGFGHYEDYPHLAFDWLFSPPDFNQRIPQQTLPVHINLWLLEGKPPLDGKEVELIVKKFCYQSLDGTQFNCGKN